jgi:energy-converting hydrogenase Eha subunit E
MSNALIFQIQTIGGFAICLFALWKGGPPERFGGGAIVVFAVLLPRLAVAIAPESAIPIIRLASDGLTAVGLLVIALAYGSLWIGGAMLLYAAQFTLHSYYFVTDRPGDRFHAVVNNADFLGIHLCLVLGTLVAWRQRVVARRRAAIAAPVAPPA